MKNQWKPRTDLKAEQDKQLRYMIRYCNENVPFYHELFKKTGTGPEDIRTVEDLQKLPVLTKDIIKKNWNELKPVNLNRLQYADEATGGSTGMPMKYRISSNDRFLGGALLYRGWGHAGYNLGDKMVFLAGTSLDIGTKSELVKKTHEFTRNVRKLSSFDMGEREMRSYAEVINSFQPEFIRGYASSIYFFAQWLEKNDVPVISPEAVFTTAEKLFPPMRKTIGRIFGCEVFDGYGLHDGGVTAFECPEHSCLHIDTERSVMEVVDSGGCQVDEGQGQILATSLHNLAMPFIRYRTEDLASIFRDTCACGRQSLLLKDIIGREKEFLITPSGQYVHGAALFNLIFYTIGNSPFKDTVNAIREFQIVQKSKDMITIQLVCDSDLPEGLLQFIRTAIQKRFYGWDVEFRCIDAIDRTHAGKYKFIVNELTDNGGK